MKRIVVFLLISLTMPILASSENVIFELITYVIPYGILYGMSLKYPIANTNHEVLS